MRGQINKSTLTVMTNKYVYLKEDGDSMIQKPLLDLPF